jgi:hypothetical protein
MRGGRRGSPMIERKGKMKGIGSGTSSQCLSVTDVTTTWKLFRSTGISTRGFFSEELDYTY